MHRNDSDSDSDSEEEQIEDEYFRSRNKRVAYSDRTRFGAYANDEDEEDSDDEESYSSSSSSNSDQPLNNFNNIIASNTFNNNNLTMNHSTQFTVSPFNMNINNGSTTTSSFTGSSLSNNNAFVFGQIQQPQQTSFVFGSGVSSNSNSSGFSYDPTTSRGRSPIKVKNRQLPALANHTQKSVDEKLAAVDELFSSLPTPPVFNGLSSVSNENINQLEPKKDDSLFSILKLAARHKAKLKRMQKLQKDAPQIHIKSYERDIIIENGDLKCYAFKPFLKVAAPNFYLNFICNQNLLAELDKDEIQTLNVFIQHIYSGSMPKPSEYTNPIFVLFIFDMSGEDFIHNSSFFLQYLTFYHWKVHNGIDTMVVIDKYMSFRKRFFSNDSNNLFLEDYRLSCLELIGSNSYCKEFDVNADPRVKDYVLEFYQFRTVNRVQTPQFVNSIVRSKMDTIYNVKEDSDVVVEIPISEGETNKIYCHKSVLSSISEIMEVTFEPNWDNEQDEDGRTKLNVEHLIEVTSDPSVIEYILKYAYGAFSNASVPSKQVIPLIKAAHFYRIQSLLDECLYLCLSKDQISYFEIGESLEDHLDDETMQAFEDFMVMIGSSNYSKIITADASQLMRLPKRLLIKIFKKMHTINI